MPAPHTVIPARAGIQRGRAGGASPPPPTVAVPRTPTQCARCSPNRPPPTQRPFALSLSKGRVHPATAPLPRRDGLRYRARVEVARNLLEKTLARTVRIDDRLEFGSPKQGIVSPPSRLWLWIYICNASQQLQSECINKPVAATPDPQSNVQKSPPQLRPARKTMSLDAAPTLIIHPKAEAGIRAVARWLLVIPDVSNTENCVYSGKIGV